MVIRRTLVKEAYMLDAEWEFYEKNRDGLVEKYCGKYIGSSEQLKRSFIMYKKSIFRMMATVLIYGVFGK
jgi:hypothetical protein